MTAIAMKRPSTAKTETFEDVQKLIYSTCWRWHKSHGGLLEDLISQAYVSFLIVYEQYQNSPRLRKWNLSTILSRRIWFDFKSKARYNGTHYEIPFTDRGVIKDRDENEGNDIEYGDVECAQRFDLRAFLFELSEDAVTVAKLAFEQEKKAEIVSALKEEGWSMVRIMKSFEEITEALS